MRTPREAPQSLGSRCPVGGMAEPESETFILEFLYSLEGLELNRAFVKISDPKVRKSVGNLVRAPGADSGASMPARPSALI